MNLTTANSCAIDIYTESILCNTDSTDIPVQKKTQDYLKQSLMGVVCLIGATSVVPTLTDDFKAPSISPTYGATFDFKDHAQYTSLMPAGYEIRNKKKIEAYINRYTYLRSFLEASLSDLKEITSTTEFALEYEGIKEEEWESLFLIVYLENDDDDYVSGIEDRIYNKWLGHLPDYILRRITISFDWK